MLFSAVYSTVATYKGALLHSILPLGAAAEALADPAHGPVCHGERSRLQLLRKLPGTVTAAFAFWLFNLAVPVHLRVF